MLSEPIPSVQNPGVIAFKHVRKLIVNNHDSQLIVKLMLIIVHVDMYMTEQTILA